jgi:hypothetical protein
MVEQIMRGHRRGAQARAQAFTRAFLVAASLMIGRPITG